MSDLSERLADRIIWTDHALERAADRFGSEGWRTVPVGKIQKAAVRREVGETFYVRKGRVVYICARDCNGVVILTVYKQKKTRYNG